MQPTTAIATADPELAALELEIEADDLLQRAKALKITDIDSMRSVDTLLVDAFKKRDLAVAYHAPNIAAAKRTLDVAKQGYDTAKRLQDDMLALYDTPIRLYKQLVADFDAQQKRQREEADRLERERARKAQDELRVKQLREAKLKAEHEADRQLLEATTPEQVEAASDREGIIAQRVEEAKAQPLPEVMVSSLAVMPEVKSKAVITAVTWSAVVVDKLALLKAIVEGKAAITLVEPVMPALNRMAVAMKKGFNVPGCEAVSTSNARRGRV